MFCCSKIVQLKRTHWTLIPLSKLKTIEWRNNVLEQWLTVFAMNVTKVHVSTCAFQVPYQLQLGRWDRRLALHHVMWSLVNRMWCEHWSTECFHCASYLDCCAVSETLKNSLQPIQDSERALQEPFTEERFKDLVEWKWVTMNKKSKNFFSVKGFKKLNVEQF